MDKAEALKYIDTKGESKFIVRTEEEEATFLANHAKKIEEEIIPSKISELHTRYDEDIFAVTGMKKSPTEKTYDFTKRVLNEFKTKAEKSEVLEKEIGSLKKQITDGTGDKKTLADLEAVQKAYKELEDSKNKEVSNLKSEYDKFKVRAEITSALSGMTFKKNIPESALKALTDQVINDLTEVASYQDGKLVFLKDGVPMRNSHNALNPYTAKELLEERMKDIRDTVKRIDGGPDLNREITKEYDKGKLTKIAMIIPDSVKSKEDLSKHLMSAGLLRGTEEYTLAYKEYSASLPIR
jgi:hypothetical protein